MEPMMTSTTTTTLPTSNNNNDTPYADADADDDDSLLQRVLSILSPAWERMTLLLSADNPSMLSILCRVGITLTSYIIMYTRISGMILWTMVYLLDHHWYLLAFTSSVAVLVVSALLLTSYEFLWRWQQRLALFTPNTTNNRVVTVEDDDNDDESFPAWAKFFGYKLGILGLWFVYCVINIQLDLWIWSKYLVATPDHNLELFFVNCLEAAPILIGAAYTLQYLHPPFYTYHYAHYASIISTSSDDEEDSSSQLQQGLL
jgi:hypothetical protein